MEEVDAFAGLRRDAVSSRDVIHLVTCSLASLPGPCDRAALLELQLRADRIERLQQHQNSFNSLLA
jgi:hypothetical protein